MNCWAIMRSSLSYSLLQSGEKVRAKNDTTNDRYEENHKYTWLEKRPIFYFIWNGIYVCVFSGFTMFRANTLNKPLFMLSMFKLLLLIELKEAKEWDLINPIQIFFKHWHKHTINTCNKTTKKYLCDFFGFLYVYLSVVRPNQIEDKKILALAEFRR